MSVTYTPVGEQDTKAFQALVRIVVGTNQA